MARLEVEISMKEPNSWKELVYFTNVDILCWALSEMCDAMIESRLKSACMYVRLDNYKDSCNFGRVSGFVNSGVIRKEVEYENRNSDTRSCTTNNKGSIRNHKNVIF